jgi:hypothetical protein
MVQVTDCSSIVETISAHYRPLIDFFGLETSVGLVVEMHRYLPSKEGQQ